MKLELSSIIFYIAAIWGREILHLKVRKIATKLCVKLHTVCKAGFSRSNWKSLHFAKFVYTTSCCDGCDKYLVCQVCAVITWKWAKNIPFILWRHMQQIQLTNAYTEHDCVTWGQCNDEGEGKGVRIWSTTADGCARWTWCHNVTIEIHSAEPIFTILLPLLWPFCQARKIWERWTARFIWYWQEISPVITSNRK